MYLPWAYSNLLFSNPPISSRGLIQPWCNRSTSGSLTKQQQQQQQQPYFQPAYQPVIIMQAPDSGVVPLRELNIHSAQVDCPICKQCRPTIATVTRAHMDW